MFHNQHESRGVHLSDYIESESDSGMKRFSLQDGQMSNCMLSARFLWYKAIIIKPFLFFPEKSVGYFIAEQNIFLILYLKNLKSATPFPKCYLHKEKWTFDS